MSELFLIIIFSSIIKPLFDNRLDEKFTSKLWMSIFFKMDQKMMGKLKKEEERQIPCLD